MNQGQYPIQVSSPNEIRAMEKRGERFLALNMGSESSLFANIPSVDPWVIQDHGCASVAEIAAGMWQVVGEQQTRQFEAAVKIVEWACNLITNNAYDPFQPLPLEGLPKTFRRYLVAERQVQAEAQKHMRRVGDLWLVNGQYLVASAISEAPHMLTNLYSFAENGKVDYAIVYNPNFFGSKRMFVGANRLANLPRPSISGLVSANREKAQELFAAQGKVFLPSKMNLDTVTAAMMAMNPDFQPAHRWLKYVEALALGNFSNRYYKSLPSLVAVGEKLQEHEAATGTWGGSPAETLQGSPKGQDTSIRKIEMVLQAMSEVLPAFAGVVRGYTRVYSPNSAS